jgi:hypothetical protein
VTEQVGKTGVVALLRNGTGPTVMVRTDMDALPMEEKTGLPYASRTKTTWNGRDLRRIAAATTFTWRRGSAWRARCRL